MRFLASFAAWILLFHLHLRLLVQLLPFEALQVYHVFSASLKLVACLLRVSCYIQSRAKKDKSISIIITWNM